MSVRECSAPLRRTASRRTRFVLAWPVAFASGCLLIAPPEDLPPVESGAHGGQGGSGATAGTELGGAGAVTSGTGGNGGESAGEGGRETSGGTGAKGGKGGAGASGKGGSGAVGAGANGARGGSGARGGKGGTGGGAGESGAPGCATNADCVSQNGSQAARCRPSDSTCWSLQTEDCPIAYAGAGAPGTARFSDPNAIFMGAMVALDPQHPTQSPNAYALELAVDEINSGGGLPDGPHGATQPIVLVVCQSDTSSDANVVKRGITHLGEDIQLQALVAELQPEDLREAFNDEKGRQLFYMNAVAISSTMAPRDINKGLIWTLLGRPQDYATAYALLLSDLEKYVRQQRGLQPSDSIKVAMVHTNDGFDDDLYQSTDPTLVFNGTSAENQPLDTTHPNGKYLNLMIDVTQSNITSQIQSTAAQIAAFAPDIVVSAAGGPMLSSDGNGVVEQIENAMPSPRPYYILSPYNAGTAALSAVQDQIRAEISSDPNVAGRFMGISAAAAPPDQAQLETDFALSFITRYPQSTADTPGQVDNLYDAVYYLAYAMYAAPTDPGMTGPGISVGMQRLITGTPLNDGPDDIAQVFQTLQSGGKVALSSTLGAPDFDSATGVRPATPGIFCFTWNKNVLQAQHWLDVLRYDAQNGFTGTYNCLTGFPP
jgi:hypothetical protein